MFSSKVHLNKTFISALHSLQTNELSSFGVMEKRLCFYQYFTCYVLHTGANQTTVPFRLSLLYSVGFRPYLFESNLEKTKQDHGTAGMKAALIGMLLAFGSDACIITSTNNEWLCIRAKLHLQLTRVTENRIFVNKTRLCVVTCVCLKCDEMNSHAPSFPDTALKKALEHAGECYVNSAMHSLSWQSEFFTRVLQITGWPQIFLSFWCNLEPGLNCRKLRPREFTSRKWCASVLLTWTVCPWFVQSMTQTRHWSSSIWCHGRT